jgi:hypothetical protein
MPQESVVHAVRVMVIASPSLAQRARLAPMESRKDTINKSLCAAAQLMAGLSHDTPVLAAVTPCRRCGARRAAADCCARRERPGRAYLPFDGALSTTRLGIELEATPAPGGSVGSLLVSFLRARSSTME